MAHRYFVTAHEWSPGINLYSSKHKHVLLPFPAASACSRVCNNKGLFLAQFTCSLWFRGGCVSEFLYSVDSYLYDTANKFMTEEKKSICVESIYGST